MNCDNNNYFFLLFNDNDAAKTFYAGLMTQVERRSVLKYKKAEGTNKLRLF